MYSNIYIHPQWDSNKIRNDVAIIKLKNSLTFSNQVSAVCLPSANSHTSLYGKDVIATGWGYIGDGNAPALLQQAKLKVANESYFDLLSNLFLSFIPTEQYAVIEDLPENNPDTNICSGDSGGPIVYFADGKWTVYGVTSYASVDDKGKCIPSNPSFFSSVPYYLDFINSFLSSTTTKPNSSSSIKQGYLFPLILLLLFLNSFINAFN